MNPLGICSLQEGVVPIGIALVWFVEMETTTGGLRLGGTDSRARTSPKLHLSLNVYHTCTCTDGHPYLGWTCSLSDAQTLFKPNQAPARTLHISFETTLFVTQEAVHLLLTTFSSLL